MKNNKTVIILGLLIAILKTCTQILIYIRNNTHTKLFIRTNDQICEQAKEYVNSLINEADDEGEKNGCTTESN